jgi:hypothetical protein
MKDTQQTPSKFQVCKPLTTEHRRGVRWFSSLAQVLDNTSDKTTVAQSLQHSIQFYGTFAETGDERYLTMCEDFLKYALKLCKA